ncbi:MAG TPA: hypothetical protein VFZ87_11710, partial [Gemmatimonadales bacterium]
MFETANAGFAQAIYEEFLRDPSAVDPEWRRLFESGVVGDRGADGQRDGGTPQEGRGVAGLRDSQSTPADNQQGRAATAPPPRVPAAPSSGVSPIKGPAAKLVANMNESLTVPTATTFRELPVAVLETRRRQLNTALQAAGRREKIS